MSLDKGILVATCNSFEWALPWWYYHYSQVNSLPITFVDLGMTKKAKKWCEKKGEVILLKMKPFLKPESATPPNLLKLWKEDCSERLWEIREKYYLKPFAMMLSPYKQTLWLDLDCEVKTNVEHLFSYLNTEGKIALVREPEVYQQMHQKLCLIQNKEVIYNGGVILYENSSPIMKLFCEKSLTHNHLHLTDQNLLSNILFEEKIPFLELPQEYNCVSPQRIHYEKVSIYHWTGNQGKIHMLKQLQAFEELSFVPLDTF